MSVLKKTTGEAGILFAALEIVEGREKSYGSPAQFMEHVAALWHAQFGWEVSGEDVAQAMVLFKLGRLAHDNAHRDSWIDICGYSSIGGAIKETAGDK